MTATSTKARLGRWLLAGIGIVVGLTTARGDTASLPTNRISAVFDAGSHVLAITEKTLYRANAQDRVWTRLNPPAEMPLDGTFTRSPKDTNAVYFTAVSKGTNQVPGVYHSGDRGSSWRLLSKDHRFTSVFVHDGGDLFALFARNDVSMADGILTSKDNGRSWRDLSAGVKGLHLLYIFPDPKRTNLVCLVGNGIRNYVLHAEDERYQWTWTREWEFWPKHPDEQRFFAGHYSTTWALYMHFATLGNYFDYDFGGRRETCAFRLVTDQTNYRFGKGEPKQIQATIRLYPEHLKVKLVDFAASQAVWGAKLKTPDTNYVSRFPSASQGATEETSSRNGAFRTSGDFRTVELTANTPYHRVINLERLHLFDQPGTYKVQLIYDSIRVADRALEEWPGVFTSAPFEVEIR